MTVTQIPSAGQPIEFTLALLRVGPEWFEATTDLGLVTVFHETDGWFLTIDDTLIDSLGTSRKSAFQTAANIIAGRLHAAAEAVR